MNRYANMIAAGGLAFAVMLAWPYATIASERPITRGIPSTETIKKELTRGITRDQDFSARPQSAGDPSAQSGMDLPTMDVMIRFEFDSADLTPFARRQLDAFGEALTSEELKPYTILVEGHTDAIGAADYNQRLSERRAKAVSDYLVQNYNVEAQRLETRGLGKTQPFNPQDPTAPENRRVTFINKGS
jgi:outer membrane protein OmpA-like peptidoglycan-associated protein